MSISRRATHAAIRVFVVLVGALAAATATYFLSREVLAQAVMTEIATRPEVENWALPYVGTVAPSFTNAVGVFLIIVAAGILFYALRRPRRPVQ